MTLAHELSSKQYERHKYLGHCSVVSCPWSVEVQKQKAFDQRAADFSDEGLLQLSSKRPAMTNLHGVYKNLIVEEPLWFLRDQSRFSQENRQKSRLKFLGTKYGYKLSSTF